MERLDVPDDVWADRQQHRATSRELEGAQSGCGLPSLNKAPIDTALAGCCSRDLIADAGTTGISSAVIINHRRILRHHRPGLAGQARPARWPSPDRSPCAELTDLSLPNSGPI